MKNFTPPDTDEYRMYRRHMRERIERFEEWCHEEALNPNDVSLTDLYRYVNDSGIRQLKEQQELELRSDVAVFA
jgi:hypothetical protein